MTLVQVRSSWTVDTDGRVTRFGKRSSVSTFRRGDAPTGRPPSKRATFACRGGCGRVVTDIVRPGEACTSCWRRLRYRGERRRQA